MKPFQDTIPHPALTTPEQIMRWQMELQLLHGRLAPCFARPEPYARSLRYLQALLSSIERRNGWQIAEQSREATPYGTQRLLSQAVWDVEQMRDLLRHFVLERLRGLPRIIAIDETGILKRGKSSAGVGWQHYGPTGDQRNCQVGVFLSLVTPAGHCLIDRELYLLAEWSHDLLRRARCGIPEQVPFRTKPELAILMLQRLWDAHISVDWVVADSVYGNSPQLRAHLQARRQPYVLAVAQTQPVALDIPEVGLRRLEVQDLPAQLSPTQWQRLSMSQGTKGPRWFDWACLPIWHPGSGDGWHRVLIRRPLDPCIEPTYYLVFTPPETTLQEILSALGDRWRIEEDFQTSKALGLDQYEVRSWQGWYRHITLVMLAVAFLTSVVLAHQQPEAPSPLPDTPATSAESPALCPLSRLEARRLLARLCLLAPSSSRIVLAWSLFRRRHQYEARLCHCRHRLKAG